MAKKTQEIVSMLIATTGHVTRRERGILDEHGYARGEYGWLIYVGEIPGSPIISEIPSPSRGLRGAIRCAQQSGCNYLLLDRDADELAGVPTYHW
jgi:hypothetical protein